MKKTNLSQKILNKVKANKSVKNKQTDVLKTQIKSETIKKDLDSHSESSSDNMSLNELRGVVDEKETIKGKSPAEIKRSKKEQLIDKKNKTALMKRRNAKSKMVIMKKRLPLSQDKTRTKEDVKTRKSKLFGFWNGPKRHRVASLNALAKVHCLYENESRSNLLDSIETTTIKKEQTIIRREQDVEKRCTRNDTVTTRTLRSVPGLRAVGKHWDMHDSTSSSDDNNSGSESSTETTKSKTRKDIAKKCADNSDDNKKPVKKRRRNRTELIMDLKDMVVRKRMASLNASAILAASYSLEKRTERGKSDDSYESDSSDDYFLTTDDDIQDDKNKKKCFEDDVKKEEDRKVIEVHTTPNKKVAVILNQDTDVTITGVYVNSTTRSTHQDGYCSIAGMQYRISATSHTQTAATAVATETLLQSSSCSAPESVSSTHLYIIVSKRALYSVITKK